MTATLTPSSAAARAAADGDPDLLICAHGVASQYAGSLRLQPLFVCNQYVILPEAHPLAARERLFPEDSRDQTVLLSDEDTCFLPSMRRACSKRCVGIRWRNMSSYRMALSFVEMGQGLCLTSVRFPLPKGLTVRAFDSGETVEICLAGAKRLSAGLWKRIVGAVVALFSDYAEKRDP